MVVDKCIKEVQRQYSTIHIGFSQINFDKHLTMYYMLKDLKELDQLKKLSDGKVLASTEASNNTGPKLKATFKERREILKK